MKIIIAALFCSCTLSVFAQDCGRLLGQQRADIASIKQVEHAWTEAFLKGGTEYLQCQLAPDYVSVSAKGVPRDRNTIIDAARKNAGKAAPMPELPEPTIQIYGDAAVVRSATAAAPDGKYPAMYSSDTFAFVNGTWRAVYSQHTAVAAANN